MTTFPGTPRVARGGLVLLDAPTARVKQIIALQYNPDTVTRTLQPRAAGQETGDRLEALRLKGPPTETIKVDAEFDASEQLEHPDGLPADKVVARYGLAPVLSAIEAIVYPTTAQLLATEQQASRGAIEVAPVEAPLVLFVWSRNRIMPVRLTDFSVTEEGFDTSLNPIRAKVSLSMRVLTVDDLGFQHRGGGIYFAYQQHKEALAAMNQTGQLSALGVTAIPGV
jgi:hypothetical protein